MNILVTLDRNYLPPLRVMLGSLLRNDPGETFEIYAIGDGLLPEDWAALEELCAGRGRIHPLEVPADLFADAPVARYWTRAMYYRLLAAELLPRSLDRVLYLDPDILVINPVRALYDTDLEGDLMAAATHTGLLAGITDPVNRLRLENYEAEAYYNSGVLVMDLSAMRREVRPGDIFDYAREHADILLLPDQDVLNGLYGGQILGVGSFRPLRPFRSLAADWPPGSSRARITPWNGKVQLHTAGRGRGGYPGPGAGGCRDSAAHRNSGNDTTRGITEIPLRIVHIQKPPL